MPETSHPDVDPAFLEQVADTFCTAIAGYGGAILLHVAPGPEGPDVGILPLDGQPPADALVGAVPPDHWCALGVAATARAWSLDRPGTPTPAEVVVLVSRRGQVVGRARHGDELVTEPPGGGLVVDCLLRAFGHPTPPPDAPITELLTVIWLARVLDAARSGPRPLTWGGIRDLHPVVGLLDRDVADTAALVSAVREVDGRVDWGRLRWRVVEGTGPDLPLTPEEATWFDDGAFSRWVLDRYPKVPTLLADLRRALGAKQARRCAALVRRMGIDPPAPRIPVAVTPVS